MKLTKTDVLVTVAIIAAGVIFIVLTHCALESSCRHSIRERAVREGKAEWIYKKDGTREWRLLDE